MKKFFIPFFMIIGFLCFAQNSEQNTAKYKLKEPTGKPGSFKENWGFVSTERAKEYNKNMPVTDVCFFSASINSYGELCDIPSRKLIDTGSARAHLVITCDSRSLTHFILDPQYGLRKKLIKDIVAAAKNFDGVNIDFELVPARDKDNFLTYLIYKIVKQEFMNNKFLSEERNKQLNVFCSNIGFKKDHEN